MATLHTDNKHFEDVVSQEYWAKHKPYLIRRSEDEADPSTVYQGLRNAQARHLSFHDSPEYQEAIRAYTERVGDSGPRPHDELEKATHRTCHIWPFPHMVESDPKEIKEKYWHNHVPYIISHASSSMDDGEMGTSRHYGKFADGEYDECRKVRMELEKKSFGGIPAAINNFFAPSKGQGQGQGNREGLNSPIQESKGSTGTPATPAKSVASSVTPAVSVSASVPAAPASTKKVTIVEAGETTAAAAPQASNASRALPQNNAPASAPATTATASTAPTDSSTGAKPVDVMAGVQTQLQSWAAVVTGGILAESTGSGSVTVSANPTAEETKGMTPEQLNVFRYNLALQARKNRIDEMKEMINLEDDAEKKKKLILDLKAFLQTPPPTLAPASST